MVGRHGESAQIHKPDMMSTSPQPNKPKQNSLEKRFAFGFESDCPFALGHMSWIAKLQLVPAGCRLEKGSILVLCKVLCCTFAS